MSCPAVRPSRLALGVPCPSADLDLVDGEDVEVPFLLLPGQLVSAEPSFSEHQPPVGFSWQFLLLLAEVQPDSVVVVVVVGWELGPAVD